MNTGWELDRGKRAGEKDLVDMGGGGGGGGKGRGGGVMARVGNDRGGGRGRGGSPVGKRPGEDAGWETA